MLNFSKDLDFKKWCSKGEQDFVHFNLTLAKKGKIHEVAAAFFFGREKLIPDMFTSLLSDLEKNLDEKVYSNFPNFRYYLERHIEIDGGEHSHQAFDCLVSLCGDNETKWEEAKCAGVQSLILRNALWDEVESRLISKI